MCANSSVLQVDANLAGNPIDKHFCKHKCKPHRHIKLSQACLNNLCFFINSCGSIRVFFFQ